MEQYVRQKVALLDKFAKENNRKTFIVGISGGVDSAVTLGLLLELKKVNPNITVLPIRAPIKGSIGTTEQAEAVHLANVVLEHFKVFFDSAYINLESLSNESVDCLNLSTPYLVQQNDYWLRPMAFYSQAMKYENSVLVSTINKTEYMLGWFSQYLDVLGVHPIVDLHKDKVYELARYFKIPEEVLSTPPKGGLASGETDEEALGFTYEETSKYFNGEELDSNVVEAITTRIEDSHFKRERFNPSFIWSTAVL